MWILQALGLGVGLAMDACAVSMSNGLNEPKMKKSKISLIALFFGLFQTIMPIFGYLAVTALSEILGEKFTKIFGYLVPWIALCLLSYLGIKMIVESFKKDDEEENDRSLSIKVLFIQAIATSIDALSVGVIYGEVAPFEAYMSFILVGIVTFIISFVAVIIGKKFGTIFSNKATLVGGIILVGIGLEIFFTNWDNVCEGLKILFQLIF